MMKNLNKYIFALLALISLSFGQVSKGTKTIDGGLAILAADGDNVTMIDLSIGQFLTDNFLIEGAVEYLNADESATSFALAGSYFMNERTYASLGMIIPEEGDEELTVSLGMLSPFMMSENVYLNPSLGYLTDSEIFTLTIGLRLFF
ncbi:MAG: hypothetical protein ACJ0RN_02585 [Candidatus Neomarinimicrobiota bacterium]|tara:strand:- start:16 stop:456 length:441 start_codon:yes stop_codon:yes gene_type:complete